MTKYYYCCSYPLKPNSVIEKGNWGRLEQVYGVALNETIFERVRKEAFVDRPSRFTCVFVFPNAANARNFLAIDQTRKADLLYEVELVNPAANQFDADMSLVNRNESNVSIIEQAARRYWRGEISDPVKREVLADSDLRIVKRLKI
jgi:hypothetical protein